MPVCTCTLSSQRLPISNGCKNEFKKASHLLGMLGRGIADVAAADGDRTGTRCRPPPGTAGNFMMPSGKSVGLAALVRRIEGARGVPAAVEEASARPGLVWK